MKIIKFLTAVFILALFFGCKEKESFNTPDKIKVSVTIAPFADIVKNIGEDNVDVNTIIPSSQDPHTFEPSPRQMQKLIQAEFYFMVGAGFNFEETWLKNFNLSDTTKKIDCSEDITRIGDNPHYWLSPKNVEVIADNIFEALVKYYPQHYDDFESNKNQFLSELDSLDKKIKKQYAEKNNKAFFVNHPAWTYYADHYKLKQLSIEKEGKPAGASDLTKIIKTGKKLNINTIFVEPQKNPDEARLIADELDAKIVKIEPLPKDYLDNLKTTSEKILRSLK